ncbi:MAG TPA: ATP-binding protein [Candidatus Limnocylindria bacterium]|nr:ATP-binding protein [Candidatus Limnocylindria bacterium]
MTIGTRLTLWYSFVLLLALVVLGGGMYYELVVERDETKAAGRPREPEGEEISEVVFFYAVPAVIVTLVGGWWLMRKALSPISTLTRAVERISANNLKERLNRSGNGDELDRLTDVFNTMVAGLESSFTREREFTIHASHELKTPLTIMRGQIETALREDALTEPQREILSSQLDEIQRLAGIVDSLFLLAKADAGLVELRRESIAWHELVQEVAADAELLGASQQLKIRAGQVEPVTVSGDRHRIRQLLLAITDNAVRYNQPGGFVEYRLLKEPGHAVLTVANSGPGISLEGLARVFDRFYRGDPARGRAVEGSGLGLSIAQWIAHSHGGTIKIESNVGSSTTVTIRLPVGV